MKKIIIASILLLSSSTSIMCMEKPSSAQCIKIKEPYFDRSKQHYAIDADYADITNVGYVHYKPEFPSIDRNNWKLKSIWFDTEYRKKENCYTSF